MATVATERESLSAYGEARSTIEGSRLTPDELHQMDAYWRTSLDEYAAEVWGAEPCPVD